MSLEAFNDPLIRKVQEKNIPQEKNRAFRGEVRKTAKDLKRRILGVGEESIVIESNSENKVVALRHDIERITNPFFTEGIKSENFTKRQYYLQKVLNILFPDTFPKMYGSFIRPKEDGKAAISGTIREFIKKGRGKQHTPDKKIDGFFPGLMHEQEIEIDPVLAKFRKNRELLEELGINVRFDLFNEKNFITKEDDSHYFVDVVQFDSLTPDAALKIEQYMRQNNFPESKIEQAKNAVSRIRELSK